MLHAHRFGPVVALLLSLPALAQEPPGSETDELIDWRAIDKHLEGHRLEREALAARAERDAARDATRPRFAIDLEAVGGRAEQTSAASSLLTLRYRPVRTLSLGAVVPFAVGASPGPTGPTYGQTGAFSVFGALDPAYGPGTTFHLGLLVALPTVAGLAGTAGGTEPLGASSLVSNARIIARTRAFEDDELFFPGAVAVVPRVGLTQRLGPVDASLGVKLPLLLRSELTSDVVVSTQVMARVFDRRRAVVAVGARAFVWPQWASTMYGMNPAFAVGGAVEPRVEARFGWFGARAGLLLSFDSGGFPQSWGVRVGVGANF